jgi:hypothetical protein
MERMVDASPTKVRMINHKPDTVACFTSMLPEKQEHYLQHGKNARM